MQKEIPFSNINDTGCTHLSKDLKFKPKKITKETTFEKLNLFSDNVNIKCKYYTTVSNSRKMPLINITTK